MYFYHLTFVAKMKGVWSSLTKSNLTFKPNILNLTGHVMHQKF